MSQDAQTTYRYRFRLGQLVNFGIGAGFLYIAIILIRLPFDIEKFGWILVTIFITIGVIPLGLCIQYWIRSFGLRMIIDESSKTIEVINNGRNETFKFNDLLTIEICEQESIGRLGLDFSFAKYSFDNDKTIVITAFMTNSYFIPEGIKPRFYEEFIPVIWSKNKL